MAFIDNIIPSTELEAVNAMLACNGKSPVDDLSVSRADVEMALNMIRSTSRGIQSVGLHCNTVRAVTLTRDGSNRIVVPTNALAMRKTVTDAQRTIDISHRHGYLWNNTTNTNVFSASVVMDIVYALDFLALPEVVRQYIFIAAGCRYQEQVMGNADISGFNKVDESEARANVLAQEGLIEDINQLKSLKDQLRANQVWDDVSKEVQSIGWRFNFRKQVAIVPDGSSIVTLPTNTLRAFKSNIVSQAGLNASHRGSIMYDVQNDVGTWDATKLPDGVLKVDIVTLLAQTDLPTIARRYIDIKAARQLQPKAPPTQKQVAPGYSERDEYLALQALIVAEGLIQDDSLLNDSIVSNVLYGRMSIYGEGNFDQTINR